MVYVIKLRDSSQAYTTDSLSAPSRSTEVVIHPVFYHFVRPCIAEFFGTLILSFAASYSHLVSVNTNNVALFTSIAVGAAAYISVASTGHLSGAHLNPAVSFGLWLGGGIRLLLLGFYILCQFAGAFVGGLLSRSCMDGVFYRQINAGAPIIDLAVANKGQAILLQLVLSCALTLTYLLLVVDTEGSNPRTASAVSVAMTFGHFLSFPVNRGIFNPSISIALCLCAEIFVEYQWRYQYVFWIGPFLGAALAALLYRLVLAKSANRWTFAHS